MEFWGPVSIDETSENWWPFQPTTSLWHGFGPEHQNRPFSFKFWDGTFQVTGRIRYGLGGVTFKPQRNRLAIPLSNILRSTVRRSSWFRLISANAHTPHRGQQML